MVWLVGFVLVVFFEVIFVVVFCGFDIEFFFLGQ